MPDTWVPPIHRIAIEDGRFIDSSTGETFVPRGVNMVRLEGGRDVVFSPAVYDRARFDDEFRGLAARGYNTVRLFLTSCDIGQDCLTEADVAGLNGEFLDVIAEVMQLARDHGLVLLLTSNDLPDGGGYRDRAHLDDGSIVGGYRNGEFLTASGHAAMATFWDDLMAGLVERQAALDVVLGWSILNEQWLFGADPPLSLDAGMATTATGVYDLANPDQKRAMVVDGIRSMIGDVASTIRSHDPDALVTMGFFSPQFPNASGIGGDWYVDTAPLVAESDLDFFDFHAYPGEDIGLAEIAENFGISESRPVVMGEVGAFVHRFGTIDAGAYAVQEWIANSCALGFDGWLYWAYDRLPADDATYGFTDSEGFLLDALAPVNQPDACEPSLENPDLSAGATASASRSLPDQIPEAAVDGNLDSIWGSGADAPQWIELRFDEAVDVGSIVLHVAQFPAGPTRHVVEVRGADGTLTEVARFEQDTDGGDLLEATFDPALIDVEAIRVTTLESPSWVAWSGIEIRRPPG